MLNQIIQPSGGIKSSGGLQPSGEIQAKGGLNSHKAKTRKNIDDAFDDFSGQKGGGGGMVFLQPFTVSKNIDGDGQIYTPTASYMHKTRLAADTQTITALNTAFALASNTHAWIEIAVTSVAPTAAELKTGTAFPALIVTTGTAPALVQTQYNLPVGRVVADAQPGMPGFNFNISTTKYHWQQLLRNHQLLKVECFSGTPVLVSTDWQGI